MERVGRLGWSSQTTLRRPTLLEGRVIVSPDTLGQIRELIGSIVRFGEQDNDLGLRTIFRDEIVLGTRSFASKIDGDRDITTFHRPLETLPDFSVMSYRSCWSPSACFILSIVATVTISDAATASLRLPYCTPASQATETTRPPHPAKTSIMAKTASIAGTHILV